MWSIFSNAILLRLFSARVRICDDLCVVSGRFVATSDPNVHDVLMKAYKNIASSDSYVCGDVKELDILKRFGFEITDNLASLREGSELLDADEISIHLSDDLKGTLRSIEILPCTDSTNDRMQERSKEMSIDGHVMMAEVQTAGRGRRGRKWETPFGRTVALTLGVSIDMPASAVSCLSLVVGVAVVDALSSVGVPAARLKWPNDVLIDGGKVGGILTELVDAAQPVEVVIGIGINVGSAAIIRNVVDYPIADVCDYVDGPVRNRLVAVLINHVLLRCQLLEKNGFAPLRERWMQLDAFRNRAIVVTSPSERISGKAVGLGSTGELLILTEDGERRKIIGGDVSLRERA